MTTVAHRTLHFNSLDDLLAEVDRIVAAGKAGTLRTTGKWTPGQNLGHLAAWIEYGYEGFPPGATPPWLVKVIAKTMKNYILTHPMKKGMKLGPRTPGGTYGIEDMPLEEAAHRYRAVLMRMKNHEVPKFDSPAFGPMPEDERIALQLRHAELHLGFLTY